MEQLTNEQLVLRIQAHDNEAENMLALWQQTKNLISKIANRYTSYAELEELEQEGYIGLCHAAQHYDSSKDILFSTYATYWIKQVITRYIDNCCRTIRVPVYAISDVRRYKRTISDFQKYNGYVPSRNEIKALLGISWKELQAIEESALISETTSLDKLAGEETEEITILDTVGSGYDLEEDCIERLDHEAMCKELWSVVDRLPENQREVIKLKYIDGLTLREIGEVKGIKQSTADIRVRDGLKQIRRSKHSKTLRGYYNEFFPSVDVRYKGIRAFERDWTSTTESMALLELMERTTDL